MNTGERLGATRPHGEEMAHANKKPKKKDWGQGQSLQIAAVIPSQKTPADAATTAAARQMSGRCPFTCNINPVLLQAREEAPSRVGVDNSTFNREWCTAALIFKRPGAGF